MNLNKVDTKTIERIKKIGKPVLIYGNMQYAIECKDVLLCNAIPVEAYVIDKTYDIEASEIQGIPVCHLDDYLEHIGDYSVLLGFMNVDKVKALLQMCCLLKFKCFVLFDPMPLFSWDDDFWAKHSGDFLRTRDKLADRKSRNVLDALIDFRLNGGVDKLVSAAEAKQYFNELTYEREPDGEVYIDCGAYNGDSVLAYLDFVNHSYKRIYAFEPVHLNMQQLRAATSEYKNIEYIEKGTWSNTTTLQFSESASASFVDNNGGASIDVVCIDEIINGESVTFIKMDVEGSEYETLRGAENTIRKHMPKLAVCVYHKKDDLFKFIDYLSSLSNETYMYRFYLRQHSCSAYETVLYAIPIKKEKSL